MAQTVLSSPAPVLDKQGIITPGYATQPVCTYRRKDIKALPHRIKEWDFYQVMDGENCLQFTYGHASYAGQASVMLFNYKTGEVIANISKLLALPFGRLHLPESAAIDSDVHYDKGPVHLRFKTEGDVRYLYFAASGFEANITLQRQTPHDMVINIPFSESPKAFYYNHKISNMTARGIATYNGKHYTFGEDAYGLLDWGRGVWPYHNQWYWSSGTGRLIDGAWFGFNLGMGFGNTAHATENILFYNDTAHKLEHVRFDLDTAYTKPWHIYDDAGRLDLTLVPSFDRTTKVRAPFVNNCCHQLFGLFHGKAVLDDGTVLQIENFPAFAEHAVNNW